MPSYEIAPGKGRMWVISYLFQNNYSTGRILEVLQASHQSIHCQQEVLKGIMGWNMNVEHRKELSCLHCWGSGRVLKKFVTEHSHVWSIFSAVQLGCETRSKSTTTPQPQGSESESAPLKHSLPWIPLSAELRDSSAGHRQHLALQLFRDTDFNQQAEPPNLISFYMHIYTHLGKDRAVVWRWWRGSSSIE